MELTEVTKEIGKSVIEALEADTESQKLDDAEHIVRIRGIVRAIAAFLEREKVASKRRDLLEQELKAFAREVFLQRCQAARAVDEDADSLEEDGAGGKYFDHVYKHGREPRR